jgi:glycosyltransferase involved in cell wall biosynthesis
LKILFVNLSPVHFDVATPEREPLGGTESCVAYLAAELAKADEVWLLANTDAAVVRSVRHVGLASAPQQAFFQRERFDVVVVVSLPAAVPAIRAWSPGSKIILWSHELPNQPSLGPLAQPEPRRAIDTIVYVSEWQRRQTEAFFRTGLPSRVIGNGLTPAFENLFADRGELLAAKELRGAYTSTPHRGLALLLDAHARLAAPLELEVYSSMQVYRQDDRPFAPLYQRAQAQPRIHYHGSVSQAALAAALRPVSFLTYPCIYPETFCIAALEAMAAGATVVTTDLGALRSTTMGFAQLLPLADAALPALAAAYAQLLDASIAAMVRAREQWAERMLEQIAVVNRECVWRRRAADWRALFAELA